MHSQNASYLTQMVGSPSKERKAEEIYAKMLEKDVNGIKKGMINRFDRGKEIDELLLPTLKFVWSEQREKSLEIARAVITTVFDGLREDQIESSQAKRYTQILIEHMDNLPPILLAEFALNIVDETLRESESQPEADGCVFEILPKILNNLLWEEEIDLDALDLGKQSGIEFQANVVERLCKHDWHPGLQLQLLSNLKDLEVSKEQLRKIVEKAVESMKFLPWTDIPNAAYHLLVLSTKGEQTLILQSILKHINHIGEIRNEENDVSADDLLNIQSTTLHHIEFACQQNQNLPSALLGLIKRREECLTPFTLAVLLTIARTKRFEDLILKFLQRYISDYHSVQIKCRTSRHMDAVLNQSENPFFSDIHEVIDTCVKNGSVWNDTLGTLVELAFHLLASGECPPPLIDPLHHNLKQKIHCHAAHILTEVFRQDERARRHIAEQLLFRLMNPEEKNIMGTLEILKVLIQERTTLMMNELLTMIKESIDCIAYMPSHLSREFFLAVAPIYHLHADFRNYLQIILRKLIFKKDANSRCTAIQGFYIMIANTQDDEELDVEMSSSQIQSSKTLSMFLECINIFKRTMNQQVEVRICAYKSLEKLFFANTKLRPYILDAYHAQLEKYVDLDSTTFPFRLKKCMDRNHCVLEPLPVLLSCCLRCLHKLDKDNDDSGMHVDFGSDLQKKMSSIVKTFKNLHISELGFDLDTESMQANLTFRNSMIYLVSGTIEAFLEVCVRSPGFVKFFQNLIVTYNDLQNLTAEKPQKAKGAKSQAAKSQAKKPKKVRGKALKQDFMKEPVVQLNSLTLLMDMLSNPQFELSKIIVDNHDGLDDMSQLFVFNHLMRFFAWFLKQEKILDKKTVSETVNSIMELFPILCRTLHSLSNSAKNTDIKNDDPCLLPMLEVLKYCMNVCGDRGKLRAIMLKCDFGDDLSENETITRFLNHIHRFITPALNRGLHKHVCITLELVNIAVVLLVDESDEEETKANLEGVSNVIDNFFNHQIENSKVVKGLTEYWLKVCESTGELEKLNMLYEIGGCLRNAAGRPDATQSDLETDKQCINEKTSPEICRMVLAKIEEETAWIEQATNFARLLPPYKESEYEVHRQYISLNTRTTMHNKTFQRLRNLATISGDLCKCHFDRNVVHAILRTMIKVFKCVCAADRMLIDSKMPISKKFEKLCKEVCSLSESISAMKRQSGRYIPDTQKKCAAIVKSEKSIYPTLSYHMENHDNLLIKFGNQKKRLNEKVDLKKYVKRRQMVSFKIFQDKIVEQDDDDEEPSQKKRKRKGDDDGRKKKKKRLRSQIIDPLNKLSLQDEDNMELEEEDLEEEEIDE